MQHFLLIIYHILISLFLISVLEKMDPYTRMIIYAKNFTHVGSSQFYIMQQFCAINTVNQSLYSKQFMRHF